MDFALLRNSNSVVLFHRENGVVFSGKGDTSLREVFGKYGVHGTRQILNLIPSSLTEDEVHAVRYQLFKAGIHQEVLLPLNIALAPNEGVVLVISSGPDLCDISVVKNGEIIAGGSIASLERELANELGLFLRDTLNLDVSPEEVKEARDELVTFFERDARKVFLSGVNLNSQSYQDITLDSRDFYPMAQPIYKKLMTAVKKILSQVGVKDMAALKEFPFILFGKVFNAPGVIEFFYKELERNVVIVSTQDLADRLVDVMDSQKIL